MFNLPLLKCLKVTVNINHSKIIFDNIRLFNCKIVTTEILKILTLVNALKLEKRIHIVEINVFSILTAYSWFQMFLNTKLHNFQFFNLNFKMFTFSRNVVTETILKWTKPNINFHTTAKFSQKMFWKIHFW